MRALGGLGLVAIVIAALVVPLPWVAETPTRVAEVADAVTITFLPPARGAPRTPRPAPVSGAFLATHLRGGRSVASVLAAAVAPGRVVRSVSAEPADALMQPPTVAALRGLGLSPVRMAGTPLPVRVDLDASIDPESLGAWLHVFDATSRLDVARGRTIAAVGRVAPDESLDCVPSAAAAVTAARRAGAQVIVVAAACTDLPRGDGLVRAPTFIKAVEATGPR